MLVGCVSGFVALSPYTAWFEEKFPPFLGLLSGAFLVCNPAWDT